jgi:hypothetical protein
MAQPTGYQRKNNFAIDDHRGYYQYDHGVTDSYT